MRNSVGQVGRLHNRVQGDLTSQMRDHIGREEEVIILFDYVRQDGQLQNRIEDGLTSQLRCRIGRSGDYILRLCSTRWRAWESIERRRRRLDRWKTSGEPALQSSRDRAEATDVQWGGQV